MIYLATVGFAKAHWFGRSVFWKTLLSVRYRAAHTLNYIQVRSLNVGVAPTGEGAKILTDVGRLDGDWGRVIVGYGIVACRHCVTWYVANPLRQQMTLAATSTCHDAQLGSSTFQSVVRGLQFWLAAPSHFGSVLLIRCFTYVYGFRVGSVPFPFTHMFVLFLSIVLQ